VISIRLRVLSNANGASQDSTFRLMASALHALMVLGPALFVCAFFKSNNGVVEEITMFAFCFVSSMLKTQGTNCDADGSATQTELTLKPGYWRIESTSTTVHPCPLLDGCVGSATFSDGGDGYCAEGYTGQASAAQLLMVNDQPIRL
jgi:hypothetical protein